MTDWSDVIDWFILVFGIIVTLLTFRFNRGLRGKVKK